MKKLLTAALILFICSFSVSVSAQTTLDYGSYSLSAQLSTTQVDELSLDQDLTLKPSTIATQFVLGQLLGGFAGIITGYASVGIFQCSEGWCELGEFAGGALAGYIFGSAFGVYAVGNNNYRTASYPAVLLGTAIGMGVSGLIASQYAEGQKSGKIFSAIIALTLPMTGAMLAYSLTKKRRNLTNQTAY